MMLRTMLIAVATSLIVQIGASAQTNGPNGGAVVTVDHHPIEFVVRGQELVFYLGDHDGKPMATKGLKARAIVQDGGKTMTVTLSPAPPNLFVGKLAAPPKSKARVVFSTVFDGHSLQARYVVP